MWRRGLLVASTAVAAWWVASPSARADADVERGCDLVSSGEFREALAAFASAERGRGLSRDDVVRLLECRALARFATRDMDALEQDLVRLVSLDPGHELGDDFGPEVLERLARVRQRGVSALAVHVDVVRRARRATVRARVDGDDGELVAEVRVRARVGRGAWRDGIGELDVPAGTDAIVQYEAAAIGPGGAELETVTGRAGPRSSSEAPRHERPSAEPPEATTSGSALPWGWIVAGSVAAIGLAVVVAVLATRESDQTQPSVPMVAWDGP